MKSKLSSKSQVGKGCFRIPHPSKELVLLDEAYSIIERCERWYDGDLMIPRVNLSDFLRRVDRYYAKAKSTKKG